MSRFSTEGLETHGQPEAIDYDAEGFDGPPPAAANVAPFPARPALFTAPIAETPRHADPRTSKQYTGIIKAAMDVLSARLICLLSVIGAILMFGFAVYDPIPWRTYTVVAYACVVLFPTIYLALRKG